MLLLLGVSSSATAQESIGEGLKKIFASPTPTPHRKKKSSPTPTPSPKKKASPAASAAEEKSSSSDARKSPSPTNRKRQKKESPTPAPEEETASPSPSPSVSPTETPQPEKSANKRGAPTASLAPEAITGFEHYPEKVKQLLGSALELTTRNLGYKYGSADPGNGGMDCSGFVYYILKQNGVPDVPRDSSEQYVWVRRAGRFEPVVSRKEDSFEFEHLKPGDLLFWTGTYSIERDPPITHAMIYLGREKKSGKRVMVGASDGRTYEGQQRFGVSVFDFKMPSEKSDGSDGKSHPRFVGYGHIPGLTD